MASHGPASTASGSIVAARVRAPAMYGTISSLVELPDMLRELKKIVAKDTSRHARSEQSAARRFRWSKESHLVSNGVTRWALP